MTDSVHPKIGPNRRQTAKRLVSSETIAALDTLSASGRQEHGNIVPGFGVTGGKYCAVHRFIEKPLD